MRPPADTIVAMKAQTAKSKRKRPTLREAIEFIALNDNAGSNDGVEEISYYTTTALVADLFDISPEIVAQKALKIRQAAK